jgi:hypothetical protein
MMLRDRLQDYRTAIGWGQLFFLVGTVSSSFAGDNPLGDALLGLFTDVPLPSSLQGFAAGLSVPLMISSILLNLRGARLYRRERDAGR